MILRAPKYFHKESYQTPSPNTKPFSTTEPSSNAQRAGESMQEMSIQLKRVFYLKLASVTFDS